MTKMIVSMCCAALVARIVVSIPASISAQSVSGSSAAAAAVPDFSGVYYPVQQGRGGGAARAGAPQPPPQRGAPPPGGQRGAPAGRPTQSAPISDGSLGRGPDASPLNAEYLAKWEVMRKSRMSGSYEFDNVAKCLPPGMPAMMAMAYGMEVMQTKDKVTFFSELNDALRRVYLDGRKPTQKQLDDPTYAGYSTGHWEGDTLVIDTVALHPGSFLDGFSPHSDAMTIKERMRFASPGILEDRIVVTDPKALTRPWESVRTYRKASPPNDELREFACAEGLADAK